jgi:hypothetical protein
VASGGEIVGMANGREVNNAHIVTYIDPAGRLAEASHVQGVLRAERFSQ